jgi:hypothetical protein
LCCLSFGLSSQKKTVALCKGLSGQERETIVCGLRVGQSVPGTAPVVVTHAGYVRLEFTVDPENRD